MPDGLNRSSGKEQTATPLLAGNVKIERASLSTTITLGLYRDAFDTVQIADCLAGFTFKPVEPMLAAELSFYVHETKEVQGPFDIIERVKLNAHVTSAPGVSKAPRF